MWFQNTDTLWFLRAFISMKTLDNEISLVIPLSCLLRKNLRWSLDVIFFSNITASHRITLNEVRRRLKRYTRVLSSQALKVLVTILVFSSTWGKDMCQSDWPQASCKQLCEGMEIPCRLVFTCSSEVKINRLNSWRTRSTNEHFKIQTASLGATTHEKGSDQR